MAMTIAIITLHWPWLVAALLLGLAMGWIAVVRRGEGMSWMSLKRAAIVLVALVLLALSRLVPGRYGYWLDLALLMLAIYLVGCAVGSLVRGLLISRQQALAGFNRRSQNPAGNGKAG
jgi:hypothetical protein